MLFDDTDLLNWILSDSFQNLCESLSQFVVLNAILVEY